MALVIRIWILQLPWSFSSATVGVCDHNYILSPSSILIRYIYLCRFLESSLRTQSETATAVFQLKPPLIQVKPNWMTNNTYFTQMTIQTTYSNLILKQALELIYCQVLHQQNQQTSLQASNAKRSVTSPMIGVFLYSVFHFPLKKTT